MSAIWERFKTFARPRVIGAVYHWYQKSGVTRSIPRTWLSFEVALAEHCDLNCAGCDHFSPVAEPTFADYEETARDFKRLSELFHGQVKEVQLLGGEPLLHPEVAKFCKSAREAFPEAEIALTSNGIRLLKMPEEFWQACRDNHIIIEITKYPINLSFDEMKKCAEDHGVEYRYYGNTEQVTKTSNRYRLDVTGQQDATKAFMFCPRANYCVYLQHGHLYTCTIAPCARHFSKHFGVELKELPQDSINIYEAKSAHEIMSFLAKPIPFCRYCMTDKTVYHLPWHQSKKEMEEWT